MLKLAEDPFLSIQGEGPNIGMPSVFLRLTGCNLRCAFCDTKYAWKASCLEYTHRLVYERMSEVARDCRNLVVTGGEPLLQAADLENLLRRYTCGEWQIEMETNGTIQPSEGLAQMLENLIVSPKLSNSLVPEEERLKWPVLKWLACNGAIFKFVVRDEECVKEAYEIYEKLGLSPWQVILMPLATDVRVMFEVMKDIYPAAIAWGVKLLPRLHILLGVK